MEDIHVIFGKLEKKCLEIHRLNGLSNVVLNDGCKFFDIILGGRLRLMVQ